MNKTETILYLRDIYQEYIRIRNTQREIDDKIEEQAKQYNVDLRLPVIESDRFFNDFETEKERLMKEFSAFIEEYKERRKMLHEREEELRTDEADLVERQKRIYQQLYELLGDPASVLTDRIGSSELFEDIPDLIRTVNDADNDLHDVVKNYLAERM